MKFGKSLSDLKHAFIRQKERSANSCEIRDSAVPGYSVVYQVRQCVYLFSINCVQQCSIEETCTKPFLFWIGLVMFFNSMNLDANMVVAILGQDSLRL